jgi:hypothetical protein
LIASTNQLVWLDRKDWRLESVPPVSPLDGNITFKLNCHSESQVQLSSHP